MARKSSSDEFAQRAASMTKKDLVQFVSNLGTIVSRQAMASALGKASFNGNRDTYAVFGYPQELTTQTMFDMYDREGLAKRAVDGIAVECWRKPPIIKDGKAALEIKPEMTTKGLTPFLTELFNLNKKVNLFSTCQEADKMLGYSRYALIFLGAKGNLDQPLENGKVEYLQVFDELDSNSFAKETDVNSPRFGLPTSYNITFAEESQATPIHWTRVIHIREGKEKRSRIYGVPRMKAIFNYILDMHKVLGGSSEAFWLLINRGMALIAREGIDMPQKGTPEYQDFQDEIEEYQHQIRRFMRLRGFDVQDLGTNTVDASGQFDLLMTAVAGSIMTPKRIILGSERGELASSQDDKNWADVCADRQTNFCAPSVINPVLDRLIEIKALPNPSNPDSYATTWSSLFELSDLDKATLANTRAQAASAITSGAPETVVDVEDFVENHLNLKTTPNFNQQDVLEEKARKEAEAKAALKGKSNGSKNPDEEGVEGEPVEA